MPLPIIKGIIRRRLLVNFRADPAVVQPLLPPPFTPKLHRDFAVVGICLIRLEQIRPACLPVPIGISSENAAHRIAVQWTGPDGLPREGVYIPRRDTGSVLNRLAGGRLFPGEHHPATFSVLDHAGHIQFRMTSLDQQASVHLQGRDTDLLPKTSIFNSVSEASQFFEPGSTGFSPRLYRSGLDIIVLKTLDWRIRPLALTTVHSQWYSDSRRFPQGSIQYDHTLVMRNIPHKWHAADEKTLNSAACC